jgi:hypothetical protein
VRALASVAFPTVSFIPVVSAASAASSGSKGPSAYLPSLYNAYSILTNGQAKETLYRSVVKCACSYTKSFTRYCVQNW